MGKLSEYKIAILVAEGFEQVELTEPQKALEAEGAKTEIVSISTGTIKAWDKSDWGKEFKVDQHVDNVAASEYDALLLPGGVMNPDKLRKNKQAVSFVREFYEQKKPIASICHGPWLLIEAGISNGLHCTSYESIKTDLKNSGANWSDEPVVTDNGIVTSRKPDDIPEFNKKMIEEFAEGKHKRNLEANPVGKM